MCTELDITDFFNNAAPMDYSASVAEIGNDAGPSTWRAACEDSPDYFLLDTDEKRDAFRAFVRSSGAWNNEEIAAWSDIELNALCIQWISGDMREGDLHPDMTDSEWKEYEQRANDGQVAGRIYGGPLCVPEFANRVFFDISE